MEFCPNCGAKIEKNAEFCGECGYEFKKMKGIRPKQQISKKALALLIVLIVFFLIINVQNIGALFIQPKTLNLNTVSSMTLFSNRLTIDPGTLNDQEIEAFVSLIFVVVFWAWLRKRYKSGMRVTKWFALLIIAMPMFMVLFIDLINNIFDYIGTFIILVTPLLIAGDFCFFIPKAKAKFWKFVYCLMMCFMMLIINTFTSHIYEDFVWDNRDQAVTSYINGVKKVFKGDLVATDTDNEDIWVTCSNCKLEENDQNKGACIQYIQEINNYLPYANFNDPVREYKFSVPDGEEDLSGDAADDCSNTNLSEDQFADEILNSETTIDIYMNKSGKIRCEAFNGKLKKEKKDGKVVFDYYPDSSNDIPLEIKSNN